jgi:hypothetical protein
MLDRGCWIADVGSRMWDRIGEADGRWRSVLLSINTRGQEQPEERRQDLGQDFGIDEAGADPREPGGGDRVKVAVTRQSRELRRRICSVPQQGQEVETKFSDDDRPLFGKSRTEKVAGAFSLLNIFMKERDMSSRLCIYLR